MRLPPGTWSVRGSLPASICGWARFVSLFLIIITSGCSSLTKTRQEQDLVEAELRSQERHIQELKYEIEKKEGTIHSLDLEVEKLQQSAAGKKQPGEPPPPGVIKEITLGRLTGGYRNNPKSLYDDSLQFLVEPRDPDGHTIKMPGSMHIELFEITPAGLKVPLSSWDITHREVRRCWDQPLFGGPAYRILIPFKALPDSEKMRVVVRFTTLDGALFEAEKDFTIRLPLPGTAPVTPTGAMPGGYSVVTPGHMINGTLVGPMPATGTVKQPPLPAILEGTGRSSSGAELPAPPLAPEPEKKVQPAKQPEKKSETIPVIPLEPRKTPSTIPSNLEHNTTEPPPLPPPPEVPTFDKKMSYEQLPTPSERARSARPIYPQDQAVMQAGYVEPAGTALTAPPPDSWRDKVAHQLVQVEYTNDAPIKLSRPVVIK